MSRRAVFILYRASLISAVCIAFFFMGFSSFILFSYASTSGFSSLSSMIFMSFITTLLPFILSLVLAFYFHLRLKKNEF
jgi:hypothetical protein